MEHGREEIQIPPIDRGDGLCSRPHHWNIRAWNDLAPNAGLGHWHWIPNDVLPAARLHFDCLRQKRFRESWAEFADFSTMKYSISWNIQLGIYLAFGFAGFVSALARYIYPCPIN